MKKWMVLIIAVGLLLGGCTQGETTIQDPINTQVPVNTQVPEENNVGSEGSLNDETVVKYELGQLSDMEMFVDDENKVHLTIDNEDRIIYENFPDIETMDPYSILSFGEYVAKWSSDGNYIFIDDSVYDIEKDELIPLGDSVVFYWNENKGVYLAEGQVIQLGYDGAIFSEYAVGKKLKMFENGEISDLKVAGNDEHFVLNPLTIDQNGLQDATIKIPVAKLKLGIDELKQTVDTGEYRDLIKEEILDSGVLEELETEYKIVLEKIKALDSYTVLYESISDDDMGEESEVSAFLDHIEYDDSVDWNTDLTYFYEKIRDEEIIVQEHGELDEAQDSLQGMFKELKADIEQLNEYNKLKEDVAAYKKLAPVNFENIEIVLNMISNF